jgi:ketosteroid isomerase-like protein
MDWNRPMIPIVVRAVLLLLFGTQVAMAQGAGSQADHEALRKLKADVLSAINTRDLSRMDALLHKPFAATVITQDSFNDTGKLAAFFQGLFARPVLRLTKLHMEAEADELAQIHSGTFAVARGSTKERYELADGRGFDIEGRWTATAIKDSAGWKVLAVHAGTNFLDNPVINAIERNALNFAAAGAAAGAIAGCLLGFFIGRRRGRRTASQK